MGETDLMLPKATGEAALRLPTAMGEDALRTDRPACGDPVLPEAPKLVLPAVRAIPLATSIIKGSDPRELVVGFTVPGPKFLAWIRIPVRFGDRGLMTAPLQPAEDTGREAPEEPCCLELDLEVDCCREFTGAGDEYDPSTPCR